MINKNTDCSVQQPLCTGNTTSAWDLRLFQNNQSGCRSSIGPTPSALSDASPQYDTGDLSDGLRIPGVEVVQKWAFQSAHEALIYRSQGQAGMHKCSACWARRMSARKVKPRVAVKVPPNRRDLSCVRRGTRQRGEEVQEEADESSNALLSMPLSPFLWVGPIIASL
jgi:hypothetical protein